MSMPGGTGVGVIQTLARECPSTRVVVLTMHDDAAYFRVAMAAGACGYVVKKSADTELLDAIRCVARGRIYTHVQLAATSDPCPCAYFPRRNQFAGKTCEREHEVLVLIAQGTPTGGRRQVGPE
jgi:two-component system response regulator NreC